MLNNFLLEIIREPGSGSKLQEDVEKQSLVATDTGKHYKITDAVPVLIGSEASSDSNFNYVDHYNKDASYNDYFEKEEFGPTREERNRSRQIIINSIKKPKATILDIGCGGAWVAEYFLPKGYTIISMDVAAINAIKANKKFSHPRHAAVVATAQELPFVNNSFDYIIAAEVIEHVADPKAVIDHWMEKLKSGGELIIKTPFDEKRVLHTCIHCNELTPSNAHLHSFNLQNIKEYLPHNAGKLQLQPIINKLGVQSRFYYLFRFLPYSIWRSVDKVFNTIINKPKMFFIKLTKQ